MLVETDIETGLRSVPGRHPVDRLPRSDHISARRPLKASDERIAGLDERLDAMLGDDEERKIALAVPGECRDRYELAESFSVAVHGRPRHLTELHVEDLLEPVRERPSRHRLRTLRSGRIQMFDDAEGAEAASRKLSADQWITAEVGDDGVRYFYCQGQWYEIGAEYLTVIEQRIAELLNRQSDVALPAWPDGMDEGRYNKLVADQDGYVLLDQKTVRTKRFRGGGLEIADALGPGGELVCVKKASKTEPLNHLFAQGRVAVETLRYDAVARAKLVAKLPDDHPVDRTFRTPAVVYGIHLKDGLPLTPDSLFAFAKVSLLQAATALDAMGARLEIVSIPRDSASEQAA